jgi:hypothetical protein
MAYPNLPGLVVNLNDLGLQIAPPPAGPKVTLLGVTSNTGIPLREPFIVSNVGQAVGALYFSGATGTNTYPGELALAVEEVANAGATNIEVVVIDWVTGSSVDAVWLPTGSYPATRFDKLALAYDAIIDKPMDVVVPVNAWADCPSVSGQFTSQLAQFCFKATREVDNSVIGVIPTLGPIQWAMAYHSDLTGNSTIGAEVLAITGLNHLFFGTPSQSLVTEWEKYLSYTGNAAVTLNPTSSNHWSGYLAGAENVDGTLLNVASNDNAATALNTAYWTYFQGKDLTNTAVVDLRGNPADAGARISVLAAPCITTLVSTPKLAAKFGASLSSVVQNTDASGGYAAFIASLVPHSATTNKNIPNIGPLRKLSGAQANRLAARRIVTLLDRSVGFTVSTGLTGAYNVSKYIRSDYVRLTTVRITDAVVKTIRNIGQRFIGEPNTAPSRNAMAAEIDKALRQMKASRAITGYKFFITATPDQQVLGEAQVDLTIVPAFELIKITVNVSLTKE